MSDKSAGNNLHFLAHGGEMGQRMREKDWSETSLGNPETWPQILQTTLNIILNARSPMFLWWGQDLICFYNDAYRPSLGNEGKHPAILGQKAEKAWPEIWHIIKPLIDQVLAGDGATWNEDQLIPIYRNGKMEDVYWTFGYSPVNDESGRAAGVLVNCIETTEKVKALKHVQDREDQLNFTIDAADLATWNLDPATNKFVGNNRLKEWFGLLPEDEIELPMALSRIVEKDRQRVKKGIEQALNPESGGHYEIEYSIVNPNSNSERRVLAKGKALFNEENIPYRFSGTLQEVTPQVAALKKAEESERRFRNTVMQAPLGITIFRGPDYIVEMANETYLQIVGRKEVDFVGMPLLKSLPEVEEAVSPLLKKVYKTGLPYYGTEFPVNLNRYGKKELTYFDFVYYPLREENGDISGIIVVATEVTASVKAKHTLAESEKQFRNMVMQSPIPMTIFRGKDHIIEMANQVMIEKIWQKKESEVFGKSLLEVFPELKEQKYPELLNKVFESKESHRETESLAYIQSNTGLNKFYLDFEYAPLFDTDGSVSGIIVTVNDVTEKVEARKKLEEAEARLRLAVEVTELATWELDLKTRQIIYSPRLAEIFGHSNSEDFSHQQMRDQIHQEDRHEVVEKAFSKALKDGNYIYEARVVKPDNSICWIRTQGRVFYDKDNQPEKLIGTLRDITAERHHQQELQEREQKFRLLADSMPQLIWTSDIQGNLNYFNQSVYDYSGLSPKRIMKDGWLQIVHPDDRDENIKLWTNSVATGKDFLLEHRFRRYDGEYRWQLSRAIPQKDGQGNIQMWVGTSTDIQDQKMFTQELEKQVHERTKLLKETNEKLEYSVKELQKMNIELKSFAYVSSHDLQEPLRKIQTFTSRILEKEHHNLTETGKDYFDRMQAAAKRMQTLIEDLLAYSRTNTTAREFEKINLGDLAKEVLNDLKESINEKGAIIKIGHMYEARVIPFQIRQLLNNLIGNSLKFSKPGEPPQININSRIVDGKALDIPELSETELYCHLSFSDKGIGFDPQYKDRIFEVFQRLHGRTEYTGTGIGLAIVKKIVENHEGVITAAGKPNKGVIFDIYIPA